MVFEALPAKLGISSCLLEGDHANMVSNNSSISLKKDSDGRAHYSRETQQRACEPVMGRKDIVTFLLTSRL
jgi:hypothetical protein